MSTINDIRTVPIYTAAMQRNDYINAATHRADEVMRRCRELSGGEFSPNHPELDKRPTRAPRKGRRATFLVGWNVHPGAEIDVARADSAECVPATVEAVCGPFARVLIHGAEEALMTEGRANATFLGVCLGATAVAATFLDTLRREASKLARSSDPVAAEIGRAAMSDIDAAKNAAASAAAEIRAAN